MLYKISTERINTFVMKVGINYTILDKSTSLDSVESKPSKLFDSIFNSQIQLKSKIQQRLLNSIKYLLTKNNSFFLSSIHTLNQSSAGGNKDFSISIDESQIFL